jgi:hypothetical protein
MTAPRRVTAFILLMLMLGASTVWACHGHQGSVEPDCASCALLVQAAVGSAPATLPSLSPAFDPDPPLAAAFFERPHCQCLARGPPGPC